jgi:hypothetical protein
MIRKVYQPYAAAATNAREKFIENVRRHRLTAEELLRQYTTLSYCGDRKLSGNGAPPAIGSAHCKRTC